MRPALLYGFWMLLGFARTWLSLTTLAAPLALLAFCSFKLLRSQFAPMRTHALLSLLLFFLCAAYGHTQLQYTELPEEGLQGEGTFSFHKMSDTSKHYGNFITLYGTIQTFKPLNATLTSLSDLPCSLTIPAKKKLPPINCAYHIKGRLKKIPNRPHYIFKAHKKEMWTSVKNTWSLAQIRYQSKKSIQAFLHQHTPDKKAAIFLSGLVTGDFNDRMMTYTLGRLGLQHIIAISGFHFSLICAILSILLNCIFRVHIATYLLLIMISSYFIFLGASPSILRAWISHFIFLIGKILGKESDSLNNLGLALCIALSMDPLLCWNMGFQFSFSVTASILFLTPAINHFLNQLSSYHNFSSIIKKKRTQQLSYIFSNIFKQAFSLLLAVHITSIPISLYIFHKFPLMSFVYNLFFPFLVSLSITLLIISCLFYFCLPIIGETLFQLNNLFTQNYLSFALNTPINFDYYLRNQDINSFMILFFLSLIMLVGIFNKMNIKNDYTYTMNFQI